MCGDCNECHKTGRKTGSSLGQVNYQHVNPLQVQARLTCRLVVWQVHGRLPCTGFRSGSAGLGFLRVALACSITPALHAAVVVLHGWPRPVAADRGRARGSKGMAACT